MSEAFSYLYPLADAALIRKMEGAEITLERLDFVLKAFKGGTLSDQVFSAFLGALPREDFIPYVADFYLQLEDVKWTVIAGIVSDSLVVSVRNLGYTKNAGEFVRRFFADIGSAGGHRAMAKAVVPMRAFRDKFGELAGDDIGKKLQALAHEFLAHEPHGKSEVRSQKSEGKTEEEVKSR
jgi:nanoRNase/pAp phosphatase (c-di-AMP/oligoRNAs hydrolase)